MPEIPAPMTAMRLGAAFDVSNGTYFPRSLKNFSDVESFTAPRARWIKEKSKIAKWMDTTEKSVSHEKFV
ncbi:hypothetical protein N0B44_24855 [Roseibacterium beibuensis]|uniref:Uncharacterized protein n=1 Tax=[Roseibacterium] beibuensis TaxID=1193142 RepID=A0ABP9LNM7_9RHOB|nr:hypothetical protein [Roseibacterium beibuensis]MCS6626153.1 hypothetical protein [Roseibacterium beibuensis]